MICQISTNLRKGDFLYKISSFLYYDITSILQNCYFLITKMEENAQRELGMLPPKELSPEDIRGKFVEGTTHLRRRKESGRKPVHLGIILAAIVLLIYLWYAITNGII